MGWPRARSTFTEILGIKECRHLSYHEVVIDVFQVAITTCSNGLVELPELGIEARELISVMGDVGINFWIQVRASQCNRTC